MSQQMSLQTPQEFIVKMLQKETGSNEPIDVRSNFSELGLDSIVLVSLTDDIQDYYDLDDLSPDLLFQYPTIDAVSGYLDQLIVES